MAVDGCAGPEHRNDDDPPDGQDDGRRFEFPDTRYAHEDAADPLCAGAWNGMHVTSGSPS